MEKEEREREREEKEEGETLSSSSSSSVLSVRHVSLSEEMAFGKKIKTYKCAKRQLQQVDLCCRKQKHVTTLCAQKIFLLVSCL